VPPDWMDDRELPAGLHPAAVQRLQERQRLFRESVQDLALYLGKMSGTRVEIVTARPARDRRVPIYIGAAAQAVYGPVGISKAGLYGFRVVVDRGGVVPRLMRQYPNLYADTSATSGYNAFTRDPAFGVEFLDEFQEKLIFGTDSCLRSDVTRVWPGVAFFRALREEKKLSESALEKMEWKNCVHLLKLELPKQVAR
jgi:hypothetical protein